jgi:hypothetical protein
MNNNFLPYQLKKNAEQANTLATQMAQSMQHQTIWINVVSLGVDNTGDTTKAASNTTIIQNALDNNFHIYFPSGQYAISSMLTINQKSNNFQGSPLNGRTYIRGEKENTFIFPTVAMDSIFDIKGYATIDGIWMVGNYLSNYGVKIEKSYSYVINCNIYNNVQYGVTFGQVACTQSGIKNSTFSGNHVGGIKCAGDVPYQMTNIFVEDCYISGNGNQATNVADTTTGNGILVSYALGFSITNTVMEYNHGSGLRVDDVTGGDGTTHLGIFSLTCTNSYFEGNRYANVYFNNSMSDVAHKEINISHNLYTAYPYSPGPYPTNSVLGTSEKVVFYNSTSSYFYNFTDSIIDNYVFKNKFYSNNGMVISSSIPTGSPDTQPTLEVTSNNTSKTSNLLQVDISGEVYFAVGNPYVQTSGYKISVQGDVASSTATGNKGNVVFGATGIFICTATNTWKKIPYTTF